MVLCADSNKRSIAEHSAKLEQDVLCPYQAVGLFPEKMKRPNLAFAIFNSRAGCKGSSRFPEYFALLVIGPRNISEAVVCASNSYAAFDWPASQNCHKFRRLHATVAKDKLLIA